MFRYCNFIENALDYCISTSREQIDCHEIISCLKTHNSVVHSRFRYSIARDIAEFLYTRYKDQITELKLYGSTMEYTAGKFSDIDIIIKVRFSSDSLNSSLKELDKLLCEEYYRLLCEEMNEYSYFLDSHIIDESPENKVQMSKAYLEYIFKNDSVELLPALV